ncbi:MULTISPECIES: class F sortase [Streptomyces]|uniref:Class F sortase n=1 Tax=Streptomyces evansiae TaxID=3075535 RepID=A0ABU2R7V7_9ACTN|nr:MULTISPECIES: class F sortase [unclassified Streptomyces]MDT0412781.1 class F sortase [Streptomyces sp. DSM 41979]MYQ57538.1 class F sortase [Streptomyces sp. SID4926]
MFVAGLALVSLLGTGCGPGPGRTGDAGAAPGAARTTASPAPSRTTTAPEPGPSRPSTARPTRLLVPAAGVDTSLTPLGLAPDRTVEVPPLVAHDVAGWYRYGPLPGERGPAVVLGHVTTGPHRDGVFRRLGRMRAGDRVVVRRADGASVRFVVDRVRTVAKTEFPTQEVYGDVKRAELRLITCGGQRSAAGYSANVIVFAHRTGAS